MNIKISWFKILTVLVFLAVNLLSQELPHSVGLAPVQNAAIGPVTTGFDASIGNRYFAQISSSPTFQFGKAFTESCIITNVGAPFAMTFPGGLLTRNGVVYTWNQNSPYQLWTIDTVTGAYTLLFNMYGGQLTNLTGMCWDGNELFGISTNLVQTAVYRINMTTGTWSSFGSSMECAGGITLLGRKGSQYSLFVPDIVTDNLFKIDKTTGVFTLVGPLGQNINFGQDGCVDPIDNTFYAMTYTTGPELRKLDTVSGNLGPVLCTYASQATGMTFRELSLPPNGALVTVCRTGINVPIPDHGTALDSVNLVLGPATNILDVNVRITNVTHTWDSDLTFYLRKGNVGALIINKVGGSGDNFVNTVLNDSAVIPIASGTAPFTGSFIPSSPLTPFNFMGGTGDGYWKLAITDTAGGDTGVLTGWCLIIKYEVYLGGIHTIEIPNHYFLNQNYPNPFNPVTNIKFGIPESGNVRLVVYDILGREVTTLMNEHKNPGTYEVKFDASHLASGIYFYSLQTDRVTETKRMLLVK